PPRTTTTPLGFDIARADEVGARKTNTIARPAFRNTLNGTGNSASIIGAFGDLNGCMSYPR
ncbi:hypothetical protein, partial [Yinghuangia seranimata]|uniref:hypothetical protein n=1 Tax=Yinghuangia seranimata TaxID=408067 RepID=UPI00248C2369